MKLLELLIPSLILSGSLMSCSLMGMDGSSSSANLHPPRILVVTESGKAAALSASLDIWTADLEAGDSEVRHVSFETGGTVGELKSLIKQHRNEVDGVFLVGDLPEAWYEQRAFGKEERFPVDIYLMDLDAPWGDGDGDGILDSHGELNPSVYVSRIKGDTDQLKSYFAKVHEYKTGIHSSLSGAFIFKDDDWFNINKGSSFGLDRMFGSVQINESDSATMKEEYLKKLEEQGADYVYQWIHATPSSLYIHEQGRYNIFRVEEMEQKPIKGRFLNMFNCSGARFTQTNLGMSYLMETDTGLAVTGSTKVGGNYYPLEFHRALTLGAVWGEAFKSWYNNFGKKDDAWFLGMVILGDPTLKIKEAAAQGGISRSGFDVLVPPDDQTLVELGEGLIDFENSL